jgi:hypothetical protein
MPALRRSVPLVLVAALVAACGSTAQVSSSSTIGGPQGTTGSDGLGVPNAPGAPVDGTTGSVAAPGTTAGGTTGAVSGPSSVPGSTGASATGASGVVVGRNGPGVSAKEIKVGMLYDPNAGAVNRAVGVGGITSGDSRANARAIIKDINAHGGVAGRKLVPVYADFDETSTQTLDQQYAAACQVFTKDNPVFAYLGATLRTSFIECLQRAGVLFLSQSLPLFSAATFRRYPGFVELGYPNVDRLAAYQVPALADQKYFTPWNYSTGQPAPAGEVRVGVLTYSDRDFSGAVDRYLVPAIKRLGYPVNVQRVSFISTASDYGAQAAAVKAAQLSFAADRVTHVIMFESNGGLGTFFLPHSRSQRYFPRLGVSTASGSEALMESGIVEPEQMNGAVGFGWVPAVDLRSEDNPPNARWSNDERRHCLKVMRDNGITFTSGNAEGVAMADCGPLYLIQRVVSRIPAEINLVTFVRAMEVMGRSYQPAGTVGIGFAPGRNDPTDRVYYWRFQPACTCFRYTGDARTIP